MRNLLALIVVGAIGYYGWQAYQKNPEAFTKYLPKSQSEEASTTESPDTGTAEAAPTATVHPAAPTPPPPPVFTSRINVGATGVDGEKKTLPPGQFLVIERASVETKDGVSAIVPGDSVKLIERRANGTLLVSNGQLDFVVKESQVTQDVTIAQEAERREYQKRYGIVR